MSRSTDRPLSQDTVFDLLSSSRRRFVIHYLNRRDGPIGIGELATELAAWENEVDPDDLTEQQRKRVYVSLYQTHIPKLEDAGIVSYDAETGQVDLRSRAGDFGRYLAAETEPFPWQLYYVGLSITSLLFYLAVLFELPGFAAIPQPIAVLLILLAVGVSAVAQYLTSRREDWYPPLSESDR